MRVIVVAAALLVLGLGALIRSSPSDAPGGGDRAPVATTSPVDRYGAALGGAPKSRSGPDGAATTVTSGPEPDVATTVTSGPEPDVAATMGEAVTTSPPTTVSGEVADPGSTPVFDDTAETVREATDHREEEPGDEFPGLGDGEFPITSNLADGVEYPLGSMVDLAVGLLRAETTGVGRDRYPRLGGRVSVCCEALVVDAAVVLFGPTQTDPATIIVEWHADAVGDEVRTVRGSTQTRWYWSDGVWTVESDVAPPTGGAT